MDQGRDQGEKRRNGEDRRKMLFVVGLPCTQGGPNLPARPV